MAAAVAGYRTSLGSDGPPTCYDDIDLADVVLVIGSNMAEAHPVTFDRLRASQEGPARPCTIIVIDPRRTPTAAVADLHVPVAPGGDIALLNAVGRLLLEHGARRRALRRAPHDAASPSTATSCWRRTLDELCAAAGVAAATDRAASPA